MTKKKSTKNERYKRIEIFPTCIYTSADKNKIQNNLYFIIFSPIIKKISEFFNIYGENNIIIDIYLFFFFIFFFTSFINLLKQMSNSISLYSINTNWKKIKY